MITAATAVLAALASDHARFQQLEGPVAADGPDAIHRARVCLRRIRSTLRVFAGTLRFPGRGGLLGELRWAAALLGEPRDLEVLLLLVDGLARDPASGVTGPIAERLTSEITARRVGARARLLAAMQAQRWGDLHEDLAVLPTTARPTPDGDLPALERLGGFAMVADLRVEHRWRRARNAPSDSSGWHAVRKAAKAARYAHDLVADLEGADPAERELAGAWSEVTDSLGGFQDLVIAQRLIDGLSPDVDAGRTPNLAPLAAGRLASAQARLDAALALALRRG